MIYVGFEKGWFFGGVLAAFFVIWVVMTIASAVLEKMTEKKKQELEELKQQCLEKGLKVDYDDHK